MARTGVTTAASSIHAILEEPPDHAQEAFLSALLEMICLQHDLVYAEALYAISTGLVLCDACHCKTSALAQFHDDSKYFVFPMQVGAPGRVWARNSSSVTPDLHEVHPDKFLRKRMARKCGLRGVISVPYTMPNGPFFVLNLFSDQVLDHTAGHAIATDVTVCANMVAGRMDMDTSTIRAAKVSAAASMAEVISNTAEGADATAKLQSHLSSLVASNDNEARSRSPRVREKLMDVKMIGANFSDVHDNPYFSSFLRDVCEECGFVFAEALCPTKLGMALSETRYYKRSELDVFHHKSKHFIFPLKVGAPGRVWQRQAAEWHADVTALPAHIYLRRELCLKVGLKGLVGAPVKVPGRQSCCVVIFYADRQITSVDADKIIESITKVRSEQSGSYHSHHYEVAADEMQALATNLSLQGAAGGHLPHSPGSNSGDEDKESLDDDGDEEDLNQHDSWESEDRLVDEPDAKVPLDVREVYMEEKIGEGSAAHVYKARYRDRLVAVKILKANFHKGSLEFLDFLNEAGVLHHIKHKNIVQLVAASGTQRPPWMLCELCLLTLEDHIEKYNKHYRADWHTVHGWCHGLASALEFLAFHQLVHRDVKPGNILLTNNHTTLKLADFGFCIGEAGDHSKVRKMVISTFGPEADDLMPKKPGPEGPTGTFRYMSKEAFNCEPAKHPSDVYSASLVFWYMCTGERPFAKLSKEELQEGIVHKNKMRPKVSQVQWKQLAALIERAWHYNPDLRPTAHQIKAELLVFQPPTNESWGKTAAKRILQFANKVQKELAGSMKPGMRQ